MVNDSTVSFRSGLSRPGMAHTACDGSVHSQQVNNIAVTLPWPFIEAQLQRLQQQARQQSIAQLNLWLDNLSSWSLNTARQLGMPGTRLSPSDHLVRRYAHKYELEWTLITAQMYQESRFNPKARSHRGALGLMQIMPATANELGIDDPENPEQAVSAAVHYLVWLGQRFERVKKNQKGWFMLAAYNAGVGHVHDARRLAKQLGLRNDRWFGHVEKAMLLLSKPRYAKQAHYGAVRGHEAVNYVRQIRRYYEAYNTQLSKRL